MHFAFELWKPIITWPFCGNFEYTIMSIYAFTSIPSPRLRLDSRHDAKRMSVRWSEMCKQKISLWLCVWLLFHFRQRRSTIVVASSIHEHDSCCQKLYIFRCRLRQKFQRKPENCESEIRFRAMGWTKLNIGRREDTIHIWLISVFRRRKNQ